MGLSKRPTLMSPKKEHGMEMVPFETVRLSALQQAAHDLRGTEPAASVVERAMVYYSFLSGQSPAPEGLGHAESEAAFLARTAVR